jgi:hypothetical protein
MTSLISSRRSAHATSRSHIYLQLKRHAVQTIPYETALYWCRKGTNRLFDVSDTKPWVAPDALDDLPFSVSARAARLRKQRRL